MKIAYIRRFFHNRNKALEDDYIIIEKIDSEEKEGCRHFSKWEYKYMRESVEERRFEVFEVLDNFMNEIIQLKLDGYELKFESCYLF